MSKPSNNFPVVPPPVIGCWPPVIDAQGTSTSFGDGRKVEFYRHASKPGWGYAQPQADYFIMVHPAKPSLRAPLYVMLHAGGDNGQSAFQVAATGADDPKSSFLYRPPADHYALYLDCAGPAPYARGKGNSGDWWWGGPLPYDWEDRDPPLYQRLLANSGGEFTSTEQRVEETIRWVIAEYKIDPERVYLAGISMGGSGSLGFGMRRGDLFAAIMVTVPAGTSHVSQRMYFPPASVPVGLNIPDPPVVVSYSGTDDDWSKDQAPLLTGMRERRYAFINGWGPSHHDASKTAITEKCDIAFAFPWLEIKKNEAYPVFTRASSDNKAPWLVDLGADPVGQINAFFRWKNVEDTAASFAMELRLLKPAEFSSTLPFPSESTADVTLRRRRQFVVPAGKTCSWQLVRDGKVAAEGTVTQDEEGLLTLPRLTITQTPAMLHLSIL